MRFLRLYLLQSNRTALDIAVELNHVLIAELLLDRGASLTSCNEVSVLRFLLFPKRAYSFAFFIQSGESLLMRAVVAGHVNMVSLLLEEGADVTYINPVNAFLSCIVYIRKSVIVVIKFSCRLTGTLRSTLLHWVAVPK